MVFGKQCKTKTTNTRQIITIKGGNKSNNPLQNKQMQQCGLKNYPLK